MADKSIADLPVSGSMTDDALLALYQNGTTNSITGALIKSYAQNAIASQVTAAQTAAEEAEQSATQAEAARQGAAAAQTAAESAQNAAETARDQSVAAAGTIGDSVEQAKTAAGQASSAKDAAVAAQTAAETAKTAAETASGQAQTAATQAAGSATAAQTAATQAGDAKTDAETARNEAETSASSAANSASDAESAATEAEQAKTYIENMDMEGETLPAGSSVTVTKTTSPEGNLLFVIGVPQGIQGDKGDTGETGATGPQGVSVTNATVNEDGDLVITLSAGDPINAGSVIGPQGIQGDVGPTGASVDRIERTSGTGAPGTTDTYTVYLTNGQTGGTFQVYNGQNGTGTGDFMADGSVPMTGNLQMGGNRITNVGAPQAATDAVRQSDLEAVSQEVDHILDGTTPAYIPPATNAKIGGVIVGDGIEVEADGTISTNPVPTGGSNGQILTQSANGPEWQDAPDGLPPGGTVGQILTKTDTGEEWADAPDGLPSGGTPGQLLTKTENGEAWQDGEFLPLSGGIMDNAVSIRWGSSNGAFVSSGVVTRELRLGSKSINYSNTNLYIGRAPDTGANVAYLNFDNNELQLHLGGEEEQTLGRLTGLKTPVAPNEATPKSYVDTQLSTKLTTPTGTAGQLLGFTADNTVVAVDAPESGLTQKQADARYLQLTGGAMTGAIMASFGQDFGLFFDGESNSITIGSGGPAFSVSEMNDVEVNNSSGLTLNGNGGTTSISAQDKNDVLITGRYLFFGEDTSAVGRYDYKVLTVGDYKEEFSPTFVLVTLTTSGWSSNTQTVTVSGVVASEAAQLITPTPAIASQSAYYEAGIMCTGQAANSLTFTCQTVPTSNLTVYVVIQPLN